MRRLSGVFLCLALVAAACAPRTIPAPVITSPRYPEYMQPVLASALAGSALAEHQDRAWRFLQTGDLRNAQREVEAALRLDPRLPPSEATAGYVALARGDEQAALEWFDSALTRDASYVPALVGRGHTLVQLGRDTEAIDAYQRAYAVDPALQDLQRRADVLRFRVVEAGLTEARDAARENRLDAAAQAYRAALANSPDSAFLYRELGDVEARRGNDAQALEYFEAASTRDPADAISIFRIGQIRERQDDLPGAIQAYERAASLDPAGPVRQALAAARDRLEFSRLPEEYRSIASAPAVTRAALAALIGVRLSRLVNGTMASTPVVLTDVRSTWAEPWIMTVTQAGVMEGYANHTFQPEGSVSRIDLARVVAQLLPRVTSSGALLAWQADRRSFADLSPAHLAYPAASTAVASGVMTAPGDRFEPSRLVSGEEAVAAIDRLVALADAAAAPSSATR